MNALQRPALGQRAAIGTLYDARRDAFLPASILMGGVPEDAVTSMSINQANHYVGENESLKEKFAKFGLSPDLRASFLAGMVQVSGAARYLTQKRDLLPTVHRSLYYTITTKQENMNFSSPSLHQVLNLATLQGSPATHIVTGITLGARAVVSAHRRLPPGVDRSAVEMDLTASFNEFGDILATADGTAGGYNPFETDDLDIKLYFDVRDDDDSDYPNLKAAFIKAKTLRKMTEASGNGYGKPLIYTLLPTSFLITLGAMVFDMTPVPQLSSDCLDKLVSLMDEIATARQALAAYHRTLQPHAAIIRPDHLTDVQDKLKLAMLAENELRSEFASVLPKVRDGHASSQTVWQMVERALAGPASPSTLMQTTEEYGEKLEFISMAMGSGALYQPVGSPAQKAVKQNLPTRGTAYVFFFNNEVMRKDDTWDANVLLLQEILSGLHGGSYFLLADCIAEKLDTGSFISTYSNGELVTADLREEKKMLADKHMMAFDDSSVEPVDNIPMNRKEVFIYCPSQSCDQSKLQWSCFRCHLTMEYSPSDGFFYCDCGRIPVHAVGFNCQRPSHGHQYVKHSNTKLQQLLEDLPQPREVNILILGETGVGKSTFINAFVNYLTFQTLDDGIEANRLNWIIPCSFTTQLTDSSTGALVSKTIQIGSDKDEHDGSRGSSATQQATVYPLYINGNLVRLIDTPGIGDTRGPDQDKANLANVLSVLRNYTDLHGILILLKPNNARLTVMFRFCVKELLSSLHRSAAGNIAFGFTNTRGSNYKPGDTFTPLQELLADYKDVIPGLFNYNVYCFDSESFRYLAARQQGVDMGNIADYRRSWEQSTTETDRLMEYFRTLSPHNTQRTLSLNETRHLIAQLTAPMQQISSAISDSIAKSEKQATELANTQLTGKELEKRLKVLKVVVTATQLTKPKTVCNNEDCIEPVVDSADSKTCILRKHLCHNPCCLTNVPVLSVGTVEIQNCAAFTNGDCNVCGHNWREHLHIMIEYSSTEENTIDPEVERRLRATGDIVQAKKATLASLKTQVAELKQEHQFVQEAAAKFGIYMRENSITHYNDATIEYMDQLIKDEKSKLRIGASRARLDSLERDKAQYQSYVDAMEAGNRARGGRGQKTLDERGVANLVQQLYGMKHYGAMLKDVANVVGRAYEANFRERPYRVRGRKYWADTSSGYGHQGHYSMGMGGGFGGGFGGSFGGSYGGGFGSSSSSNGWNGGGSGSGGGMSMNMSMGSHHGGGGWARNGGNGSLGIGTALRLPSANNPSMQYIPSTRSMLDVGDERPSAGSSSSRLAKLRKPFGGGSSSASSSSGGFGSGGNGFGPSGNNFGPNGGNFGPIGSNLGPAGNGFASGSNGFAPSNGNGFRPPGSFSPSIASTHSRSVSAGPGSFMASATSFFTHSSASQSTNPARASIGGPPPLRNEKSAAPAAPSAPVRSITDWTNETAAATAGGSTFSETSSQNSRPTGVTSPSSAYEPSILSAAPPPYNETSLDLAGGGSAVGAGPSEYDLSETQQRVGIWSRMKRKLKK